MIPGESFFLTGCFLLVVSLALAMAIYILWRRWMWRK
jgi:hypothetical protein